MSRQLSGLRAWVVQRLSAVYIGLFLLVAGAALLIKGPPLNYRNWLALWSDPLFNLAMQVFVIAVLLHAWVGIRDVVLDYLKPLALRFSALSLVALGLLGCGLWAIRILFNTLG